MTTQSDSDFESLVPELRGDLTFSNRKHGSDLSHMIEIKSEGKFFSLGENEYRFICHLNGNLTLKEAFENYLNLEKQRSQSDQDKDRLTWEKAVQVFKFLHLQKLLAKVNGKPASSVNNEHGTAKVHNVNPYGFRLQLFDADSLASKLSKRLGGMFQKFAFLIWLAVIGWAVLLILGNSSSIMADTKVVLQPENWIWLTLCWIVLKIIHESAHAICCKKFGGKVGEAGINFLLLLPMPYVDVTDSWKFESKWKRIYVALAGVYAELFVASLFVMVWAYGNNPILDSIAVQMILMASFSTVLFNVNPLMRFDGYFVLSDLLRRPNLATNGSIYQKSWVKQALFGIQSDPHLRTYDLTTKLYGWLAAIWKLVIAVGLIFAAAKLFHGAGIVLAAAAIFLFYIRPLIQFLLSITIGPQKSFVSKRRCAVSFSFFAAMFFVSTWVPWPFAPSAVGVVEYSDQQVIRAPSDGFLVKILVRHGQQVSKGDKLVEIENNELEFKYQSLIIDRKIAISKMRELKRDDKLAEYQAQIKMVGELDKQLRILSQQTGRLTLMAPRDGYVIANELANQLDSYVKQGDEILKVVTPKSLEVVACATEFDVHLFRQSLNSNITIAFESGQKINGCIESVEPTAVQRVIHPALSAENGGPLAVQASSPEESDKRGMELIRPIFKVVTDSLPIDSQSLKSVSTPDPEVVGLKVGQRCKIYLTDSSHSCFQTVCHKVSKWLRNNWEAQSGG